MGLLVSAIVALFCGYNLGGSIEALLEMFASIGRCYILRCVRPTLYGYHAEIGREL
jgi:hypothetical protein